MGTFAKLAGTEKKFNNHRSTSSKVDLRKRVLAELPEARVLDCYAGPEGEMWRAVWSESASYHGIDRLWQKSDPRQRFVGDTTRILRTLDLAPWNVFDVDAFGDPWATALILVERRRWAKGERGALCITDGTSIKLRTGSMPLSMQTLIGCATSATSATSATIHQACLTALLKRWNAKPLRLWQVEPKGQASMAYSACVLEGR